MVVTPGTTWMVTADPAPLEDTEVIVVACP